MLVCVYSEGLMLCLLYVFSTDAMHDVLDILCQYCVEFISPCVWSIVWSLFLHVFELLGWSLFLLFVWSSYVEVVCVLVLLLNVTLIMWWSFFICTLFLVEEYFLTSDADVFVPSWSLYFNLWFWRKFVLVPSYTHWFSSWRLF